MILTLLIVLLRASEKRRKARRKESVITAFERNEALNWIKKYGKNRDHYWS